ncbi:HAMP domain-containing sensor histidine kinase [Priestia endophytica]|uniref:HAMP domain-containing sensor histidine kinase n=1 Tax=Priestia endophytica TaxID=135735 RepID=UPI002280E37A|nr:HAMP domain-containing sensor histidine kinase [Priestia endophytica]MCY8231511.1 HAMP domain-containing histidine kinase [Priestia endophytica]
MRKLNSLTVRYVLIIFIALIMLPLASIVSSSIYFGPWYDEKKRPYYDSHKIVSEWNKVAKKLNANDIEGIRESFNKMKSKYKDSALLYVDGKGQEVVREGKLENIPSEWNMLNTVEFMKTSIDGDPFTVVSYIGGNKENGLVIFQIPRSYITLIKDEFRSNYESVTGAVALCIFLVFLVISWFFFRSIRKRLLRLQDAMEMPNARNVPPKIQISRKDEIGALEQSFNNMLTALEESQQNEREEESARRKLIADLSHDLRTPLTALKAQIYSLKKEVHSQKGEETIALADEKIHYLGELIENLLSYSLLTSNKYPYKPEKTDMVRLVRTTVACWYDRLEEEGFEVDIEIQGDDIKSNIDVNWFQRMIDNVIQNVIRHAKDGQFIGFYMEGKGEEYKISVVDHGPGFANTSGSKHGRGIGMSIIALMAEAMNIKWKVDSNKNGTTFEFYYKNSLQ